MTVKVYRRDSWWLPSKWCAEIVGDRPYLVSSVRYRWTRRGACRAARRAIRRGQAKEAQLKLWESEAEECSG